MTDQMQEYTDGSTDEKAIVRVQDSAYAVPVAVLEQHRIAEERRTELAATLRERAGADEPPAEAPLFEMPEETLDAYRLSEEERAALEARQAEQGDDARGFHQDFKGQGGYPWNPYTGHHQNEFFGGPQRDQQGRTVFIGVFPAYRAPSGSGPYPGLR